MHSIVTTVDKQFNSSGRLQGSLFFLFLLSVESKQRLTVVEF